MGFEIPVDCDYFGSPKAGQIREVLGTEADVYPIRMWSWASKFAKDGVIHSTGTLEDNCLWRGERGKLCAALLKCEFLVKVDGRIEIFDWMQRTGHAVAIYEKNKERNRRKYRIRAGLDPDTGKPLAGSPTGDGKPPAGSGTGERVLGQWANDGDKDDASRVQE